MISVYRLTDADEIIYYARMARRAQHLRCSLCEKSERALAELTGDARLEFLRNSGPAPEMREH